MASSYDRERDSEGKLRLKRKSTVGEDISDSIKSLANLVGGPFALPKRRANTVEVSVNGSRSKRKYY